MIFKQNYQYKKAGIIAMKLTPAEQKQFKLFSKKKSQARTIDEGGRSVKL